MRATEKAIGRATQARKVAGRRAESVEKTLGRTAGRNAQELREPAHCLQPARTDWPTKRRGLPPNRNRSKTCEKTCFGRRAPRLPVGKPGSRRNKRWPGRKLTNETGDSRQPGPRRKNNAERRLVVEVPNGARFSSPNCPRGTKTAKSRKTAQPGWFAIKKTTPALCGKDITKPDAGEIRTGGGGENRTSTFCFTGKRRISEFNGKVTPARIAVARPVGRRSGPGIGRTGGGPLRPLRAVVSSATKSKTRPIINFAENRDGERRPQPAPRFSVRDSPRTTGSNRPRELATTCRSGPADQPQLISRSRRVSATLRRAGAPKTANKARDHRASPFPSSFVTLLLKTFPRAGRPRIGHSAGYGGDLISP